MQVEVKMEVIREFRKPGSTKVMLDIPEEFVEKDLEILIMPVNEDTGRKPDARTGRSVRDKQALFENLCGLWEGREDLTLESIRNKAWKRI